MRERRALLHMVVAKETKVTLLRKDCNFVIDRAEHTGLEQHAANLAQSRGTRSPPGISSRSSAETDLYVN